MPDSLRDVVILGVHPVEASDELFEQTLELQWGSDLSSDDLRYAREQVREHFAALYLIEVRLDPPNAEADWSQFTQSRSGQVEDDWQVAYDERAVDESTGTWAFFVHDVDLTQPLQTPVGPRALPQPSPCPPHLDDIEYEAP